MQTTEHCIAITDKKSIIVVVRKLSNKKQVWNLPELTIAPSFTYFVEQYLSTHFPKLEPVEYYGLVASVIIGRKIQNAHVKIYLMKVANIQPILLSNDFSILPLTTISATIHATPHEDVLASLVRKRHKYGKYGHVIERAYDAISKMPH